MQLPGVIFGSNSFQEVFQSSLNITTSLYVNSIFSFQFISTYSQMIASSPSTFDSIETFFFSSISLTGRFYSKHSATKCYLNLEVE